MSRNACLVWCLLSSSWLACGSRAGAEFDAPEPRAESSAGAAGQVGVGGGAFGGTAGMLGAAGTAAAAGSAGSPISAPCSPVREGSAGMSGPFNSVGPVCLRVTDAITGWGCSNFEGRTVKVNGVQITCAAVPLPPKVEGAYYFDISAGQFDYASMYWFQ